MAVAEIIVIIMLILDSFNDKLSDAKIQDHINNINNQVTEINTEIKDYEQYKQKIYVLTEKSNGKPKHGRFA